MKMSQLTRVSSGLAAAVALGLASASFAGDAVDWNADGTVSLKLGETYDNTVITVPAADLGALIKEGEQPFAGTEITVSTLASGPKGGISGPLHAFRPVWEELTGGKVTIVELPYAEAYSKMLLDVRTGTGEYDGFIVGAFWYGDIAPQGYAYPIDDLIASGDHPKWSYDVMPDSLRALHTWEGEGFGILNDADGQVLYYRKSALTDPAHAAAFKSEYGYDLPVPPTTWQQLRDVAAYFNGKNWDANDDDADSGMVLHLKVGEQGHYHFQSLSASFAVTPGPEVSQHHNVYWFDPMNMKPMINSPGHVKALEFLLDLHKTGPSAQVGWALGEAWDYFLRGKAVFVFSWGDVGSLCQDTARSKIQGDCASAILPASEEYYDHASGEFVTADNPVPVGNTTGGSWHGVVSAFSANPEATFSFWSLMAMKEVSLWNSQFGWTGVDPGYSYQFLKPLGEATVDEYVAAGWDAEDVKTYTQAYHDNFYADTILTYLRIPGTFEYWDILDKNLSATMSGELTPQQALDRTAETWEGITDRLGREEQLKYYQDAIGYGG